MSGSTILVSHLPFFLTLKFTLCVYVYVGQTRMLHGEQMESRG